MSFGIQSFGVAPFGAVESASGGATITATFSIVESPDVFAASGTLVHPVDLAGGIEAAPDLAGALGNVQNITATFSIVEAPDVFSASATLVSASAPAQPSAGGGDSRQRRRARRKILREQRLPHVITGTLSVREAPDTFSMRGYLTHRAEMSVREAADTFRMHGELDIYALAKRQDEEWLLLA